MALFQCEACNITKEVSEKFAGKMVKCPNCKGPVRISDRAVPVEATPVEEPESSGGSMPIAEKRPITPDSKPDFKPPGPRPPAPGSAAAARELPVTWGRVIRVWWAYLWRSILVAIGATVIGMVVGGVIGMGLGIVGISPEMIAMITTPIGLIIGIIVSIFPIKMILNKDFGDFRLALMERP